MNPNNKVNRIYKFDNLSKKIDNFLATKNGKEVVNNIHRFTLEDLVYRYNLKYLLKMHSNKQSIMDYIRNKVKNENKPKNIIDYTHTNETDETDGYKYIHYPNLTKKELKKIWDTKTSPKLQYAERMSMLEQHKIDRWEKENKPTFEQLKNDFFPRSIIQAFNDKLFKKREEIRLKLAQKYEDPINKPVYIRYYSTPEIIKEKLIGYVRDIKNTIRKKPSFYTLEKVDKYLYNQIKFMQMRMKAIFNDDFICLKVMTANNHVGCWA